MKCTDRQIFPIYIFFKFFYHLSKSPKHGRDACHFSMIKVLSDSLYRHAKYILLPFKGRLISILFIPLQLKWVPNFFTKILFL